MGICSVWGVLPGKCEWRRRDQGPVAQGWCRLNDAFLSAQNVPSKAVNASRRWWEMRAFDLVWP